MSIAELNRSLDAFRGGYGRLWDFSPTHNRLAVELSDASRERRSYLVLLGCTNVLVPTSWRLSRPSLKGEEPQFVFEDQDVEIRFAYEAQLEPEYSP